MKLSYLITVSNETDTLTNLLFRLSDVVTSNNKDEIVYLIDEDTQNNEVTKKLIDGVCCFDNVFQYGDTTRIRQYLHPLANNYSEHKNWGAKQCTGDFIFQIDGDELPTETLLLNLKDIIESNPGIEAFWVSRINDFRGVTPEHAKQWGWRLTESPTYKRPLVNWPDPQCRVFMNKPDRIKWVGRLHERIEGHENFVYLPIDEELALYHDKTIEKQVETNIRYNQKFTDKENRGFNLPK
jgi:hypothetical protein